MKAEYQGEGPVPVLRLLEPIVDINNISEFRDLLEEKAREGSGPLVLDLSETSYVGSVGLGMISLVSIMLEKEGRRFAVVARSEEVRRVFQISGLHKVMLVVGSLEDALSSLSAEA